MYIYPGIDQRQLREKLAELMAAAGHTRASIASAAGLVENDLHNIFAGAVDNEKLGKLADVLKMPIEALAPRLNLRDPDRRDRIPPEGRDVPQNDFWARRLRDGDVELGAPPQAAAEATAAAPRARARADEATAAV